MSGIVVLLKGPFLGQKFSIPEVAQLARRKSGCKNKISNLA